MVRAERSTDVAAIRDVVESAFDSHAEARLVDALRDSGALAVSLVGIEADRIVGHVALSPVTTTPPQPEWRGAGLAPLAVVPGCQRRGIGASLVEAALHAARDAGFDYVVVLGRPSFYARFGFERASEHGLRDRYGGGDAFRVATLKPGVRVRPAVVDYAPPFAELA